MITIAGAGGSPVLGTLTLASSNGDVIPPGSTTNRTLILGSGTVTGSLETTIDVVSPGGQVVTIDVNDQISADAVTTSLLASSATVVVAGRTASLSEEPLDVEDLDQDLIDGIQSGSVVLDITNPFGVSFSGDIIVGPVSKTVSIPSDPTSTVEIVFTGTELQDVLNALNPTFSGTGTLGGGPAVVTPTDELLIDPSIDLVVEIGG